MAQDESKLRGTLMATPGTDRARFLAELARDGAADTAQARELGALALVLLAALPETATTPREDAPRNLTLTLRQVSEHAGAAARADRAELWRVFNTGEVVTLTDHLGEITGRIVSIGREDGSGLSFNVRIAPVAHGEGRTVHVRCAVATDTRERFSVIQNGGGAWFVIDSCNAGWRAGPFVESGRRGAAARA